MPENWPDADLERRMLAEADLLQEYFGDLCHGLAGSNCAYHVRALLERVRELERQLAVARDAAREGEA